MQDAVAADVVSVAPGPVAGSLAGTVALFANPFLDGKEEALAVDNLGQLTYLQRRGTSTGWQQSPVTGGGTEPIMAAEVVVVVHPRDLTYWAIYAAKSGGKPQALQLVSATVDGVLSCSWQAVPAAILIATEPEVTGIGKLYTYYDGRTPCVTGLDPKTGQVVAITVAMTGIHRFACTAFKGAFAADELAAGPVSPMADQKRSWAPVCYLRIGKNLIWYNTSTDLEPRVIARNVARLVGVYRSFAKPDLGCVYLDTSGNLVTSNHANGDPPVMTSSTPGLGFVTATSWVDVNQMLHVYGLDAHDTLQVLHQVSWAGEGVPVWSRTVIQKPKTDQKTVPALVGLVSRVASFGVDPFPDEMPNQLLKLAGVPQPDEQFSFHAQDISSARGINAARWSRDKVRKPSDGDPHFVTHYVSEVTVLDQGGTPMSGLTVTVSAETLAEVQVDGASYLVGPGHSASLATNALGKITICTPADSLLPATLHVDISGLTQGAVIQPAAEVHDYLGGTGTLASQQGMFDKAALTAAKGTDGKPIVDPDLDGSVGAIVSATKEVFRQAEGRPMTSNLSEGDGPAPPIHGFVVGPAPGRLLGVDGAQVEYTEFTKPEDFAAHLDAIRRMPQYAGVLDDFLTWAGDVWQGIKDGAVRVYAVAVEAITTVIIWIGDKIVELAAFAIETVAAAARAAEAVLRQIIPAIGPVLDWLKSLFSFKDIWDTAVALESGATTVLTYGLGAIAQYGDKGHEWFEQQKIEVTKAFTSITAQYEGRPLGDAGNQIPAMIDASGQQMAPTVARDSPQATWLLNRTIGGYVPVTAWAAPDPVVEDSRISDAFAAFLKAFTDTDIEGTAVRLLGDLQAMIAKVTDVSDPASAAKASVIALFDIVEGLVLAIIDVLDRALQALMALVAAVAENPGKVFAEPLTLGPVNTLYKWIQREAGVHPDKFRDLTYGGLIFLMAGFATTTAYKLVNGVGHGGPFPGGHFPAITAPHWHPDYDPTTSLDADQQRAINAEYKWLQAVCASAGIIGGVLDCLGDLAPLVTSKPTPRTRKLGVLLATGSTLTTGLLFNTLGSCPPVTGTAWDAPNQKWAGAFATTCVGQLLSIGLIAYNIKQPDAETPFLKNLKNVMLGPLMPIVLSSAYIACVDLAAKEDKTNIYTHALLVLGGIPGLGQALRFGIRSQNANPFHQRRGMVAAGFNATAQELSAAMLLAGAVLTVYPVITPDQVLKIGEVGVPYSVAIEASGGDRVFNRPLKDWTLTSGALPAGLTLDQKNGKIVGTPTAATSPVGAKFSIRCNDSYGPPQISLPCELTIVIRSR
jgi:hypothetical protein